MKRFAIPTSSSRGSGGRPGSLGALYSRRHADCDWTRLNSLYSGSLQSATRQDHGFENFGSLPGEGPVRALSAHLRQPSIPRSPTTGPSSAPAKSHWSCAWQSIDRKPGSSGIMQEPISTTSRYSGLSRAVASDGTASTSRMAWNWQSSPPTIGLYEGELLPSQSSMRSPSGGTQRAHRRMWKSTTPSCPRWQRCLKASSWGYRPHIGGQGCSISDTAGSLASTTQTCWSSKLPPWFSTRLLTGGHGQRHSSKTLPQRPQNRMRSGGPILNPFSIGRGSNCRLLKGGRNCLPNPARSTSPSSIHQAEVRTPCLFASRIEKNIGASSILSENGARPSRLRRWSRTQLKPYGGTGCIALPGTGTADVGLHQLSSRKESPTCRANEPKATSIESSCRFLIPGGSNCSTRRGSSRSSVALRDAFREVARIPSITCRVGMMTWQTQLRERS
jgi:hypothetical protein